MLSDTVSDQIAMFRKSRGWNTERLAEECAALGLNELTAAVIRNIESGRRNKDGIRRRTVSVDELAGIARALTVPITWLLVPYPEKEEVEVTPKETITSWQFNKEVHIDSTAFLSTREEIERDNGDSYSDAIVLKGRVRFALFQLSVHEDILKQRENAVELLNIAHDRLNEEKITAHDFRVERARVDTMLSEIAQLDLRLIQLRKLMQERDYPLPGLPDALQYLDDLTTDDYAKNYTMHLGRYGLGATRGLPEIDIFDFHTRLQQTPGE